MFVRIGPLIVCQVLFLHMVTIGIVLLSQLSSCWGQAQGDKEQSSSPSTYFDLQVWPILQKHCLACHGPQVQEGGFRVDSRQALLESGESYAPNLVPNQPKKSNLVLFVGENGDLKMPPEGPGLNQAEVSTLSNWVGQGATWSMPGSENVGEEVWWSLRTLNNPEIPQHDPTRNPIDSFVLARLDSSGLKPAPSAERRTLIRRVYFDLIGLPPEPHEVDAFLADSDEKAYLRLVDRLLNSPRYGERWARHWLDISHYAETHGHDQDRVREHAWPYRDYLIKSFNEDKSFGRFLQEQVAGDMLFPEDPWATIALGFLAAGPWDESSLRDIREDTLDRQIGRYLDRDDIIANVMNNFASTTVQCARCHDHKFDPIPQSDYYALQSVFSGIERANRVFDFDPRIHRRRQELLAQRRELDSSQSASFEKLNPEARERVRRWEDSVKTARTEWLTVVPEKFRAHSGSSFNLQADGSLLSVGNCPDVDTYEFEIELPIDGVRCLRLETLSDRGLPQSGPGRQDNGNFHLSEFEIFLGSVHGERLAIRGATADFDQTDWGIVKAIDGNPQTAWGIFPHVGQAHQAVFELSADVCLSQGERIVVVLKQFHGGKHLIGRPKLSVSNKTGSLLKVYPAAIESVLETPELERSNEQIGELIEFVLRAEIEDSLAALPAPSYVYAAAQDFEPDGGLKPPPGPRVIHVLNRGDIRQPLAEVGPGALSIIKALNSQFVADPVDSEGVRRAQLAQWLIHPENPLVWRSIVNRVWHYHFGRGIVTTPNDFGRMGALPSHPELLNWLASWFRDNGQSLKELHRLILTSKTYQQSTSNPSAQAMAADFDADNRLLWRMNRIRLDAESIHDAVLSVSGRLDLRMGGPSDRQFDLQPGSHVTPILDYGKFDLDSPAARRRSIYRFLFRTLPDPFMESLDCPAGDTITPTRENSVTVQQSLAMWNDAFIMRYCEHFATRLESLSSDPSERLRIAFQLVLGRNPSDVEASEFLAFANDHGWANLARVLFNLNEFVFVD